MFSRRFSDAIFSAIWISLLTSMLIIIISTVIYHHEFVPSKKSVKLSWIIGLIMCVLVAGAVTVSFWQKKTFLEPSAVNLIQIILGLVFIQIFFTLAAPLGMGRVFHSLESHRHELCFNHGQWTLERVKVGDVYRLKETESLSGNSLMKKYGKRKYYENRCNLIFTGTLSEWGFKPVSRWE